MTKLANPAPPIAFGPENCEQLHFCVLERCLAGTPNPVNSNVDRIALKSPNIRNSLVLRDI